MTSQPRKLVQFEEDEKFEAHSRFNSLIRQRTLYRISHKDGTFAKISPHDGNIVLKKDYNYKIPDWLHLSLQRMTIHTNALIEKDSDITNACEQIHEAIKLRDKYVFKPSKEFYNGNIGAILPTDQISLDFEKLKKEGKIPKSIQKEYYVKFNQEYNKDLEIINKMLTNGPVKTLCYKRLQILENKYKLHLLLNEKIEQKECLDVPYRDFYNVRKIDNHIHHSACMNQRHLLRFIKDKIVNDKTTIVDKKNNKTLDQIFDELNINSLEISIDLLDVHANNDTFHRFDKFNSKYNPLGVRSLRNIFLKIDNDIKGKYLAEITQQVFNNKRLTKYSKAEYRISIYGKNVKEWEILSNWIVDNKLQSMDTLYMIQMPRIYQVWKEKGLINSFGDMLYNFFNPLFEVSLNPNKNPNLFLFLQMMVGFDSVDDESQFEKISHDYPTPDKWTFHFNPPYIYYMYYMYINIIKLNRIRQINNLNLFSFRPHCGEAGAFSHLSSCYLLSNSINHGLRLEKSYVLQYLYYIKQIGISMSPLSNNILFKQYNQSPFPQFFNRGLNITLSTDDPLLIHFTNDALLEEYGIASQVFNLSNVDLCEIARNSVLQSGFSHISKKQWIGDNYNKEGIISNDIIRTNVPNTRIHFRYCLLNEELEFINSNGYPNYKKLKINDCIEEDIHSYTDSSNEIDSLLIDNNDLLIDAKKAFETAKNTVNNENNQIEKLKLRLQQLENQNKLLEDKLKKYQNKNQN